VSPSLLCCCTLFALDVCRLPALHQGLQCEGADSRGCGVALGVGYLSTDCAGHGTCRLHFSICASAAAGCAVAETNPSISQLLCQPCVPSYTSVLLTTSCRGSIQAVDWLQPCGIDCACTAVLGRSRFPSQSTTTVTVTCHVLPHAMSSDATSHVF
jgi:hypothetical protein